jgi:uncharacterized protein YcbK (DUF882 family)
MIERRKFLATVAAVAATALGGGPAAAGLIIDGLPPMRRRGDRIPALPDLPDVLPGIWQLDMTADKSGENLHLAVTDAMTDADRVAINHFFRDYNDHGAETVIADRLIVSLADLQRRAMGVPLVLYSGYRTPRTNAAKPGTAQNSRHLYGEAADISISGRGEAELFGLAGRTADALHLGFGKYHGQGFVHLDVGRERRWVV